MNAMTSHSSSSASTDTKTFTEPSGAYKDELGGKSQVSSERPQSISQKSMHVSPAYKETRNINILRAVSLILLLTIVVGASVSVYYYTRQNEKEKFCDDFAVNARRILTNFQETVERKMGALSVLSDEFTTYSLASNNKFPFITLPNFAVATSGIRTLADTMLVQWSPLVDDDNRLEWEEFALKNRFQWNSIYEQETDLRFRQDDAMGWARSNLTVPSRPAHPKDTVLDDNTLFHPQIWSKGHNTPRGPEKNYTGPYLPLWQRVPILQTDQSQLNANLATSRTLHGVLQILIRAPQALLNPAEFPNPNSSTVQQHVQVSQYRTPLSPDNEEGNESLFHDPHTFFAYPVFDSFETNRTLAGVLSSNTYWRMLLVDILPPHAVGYICVLENSYNQTLSYRVDGTRATYLGRGDYHDLEFDHLKQMVDVNEYVQQQAGPRTRSYTAVPLNQELGRYTLRIYPTAETQDVFLSNKLWVYTMAILAVFVLTSIVLFVLDRSVARRQRIVLGQLVKAAEDRAAFEHELNGFLAHEVRNPVAAAMTAHGFVVSAVNEIPHKAVHDGEWLPSLKSDVSVIGSSLAFIDDFLRSNLDDHAARANKLKVNMAPTDLLKDVLEPVCSVLYIREGSIDVSVECPESLWIMTDRLRLKQVMMNLGRNSIKFTERGFVRFRAVVINDLVQLHVEDSGGGIPREKRDTLFEKYQESLDVLSQGTGIGLSLCKNLVTLLNGQIFLDEEYDSGIAGLPGAAFVVQLKQPRLPADSVLDETEQTASLQHSDGTPTVTRSTSDSEHRSDLPEKLSVLFVDDDNVLRKLFVRGVRKAAPSWEVAEAASGEAALQLVETDEFDIIFMDQYMASTEKQLLGTETVHELRRRGVDSTICGLSANNMKDAFLNAGADTFLLKPFPCDREAMERELFRISQSRVSAV